MTPLPHVDIVARALVAIHDAAADLHDVIRAATWAERQQLYYRLKAERDRLDALCVLALE